MVSIHCLFIITLKNDTEQDRSVYYPLFCSGKTTTEAKMIDITHLELVRHMKAWQGSRKVILVTTFIFGIDNLHDPRGIITLSSNII